MIVDITLYSLDMTASAAKHRKIAEIRGSIVYRLIPLGLSPQFAPLAEIRGNAVYMLHDSSLSRSHRSALAEIRGGRVYEIFGTTAHPQYRQIAEVRGMSVYKMASGLDMGRPRKVVEAQGEADTVRIGGAVAALMYGGWII